jgi:hypothetical protein
MRSTRGARIEEESPAPPPYADGKRQKTLSPLGARGATSASTPRAKAMPSPWGRPSAGRLAPPFVRT